jgi:hypothetical protein
MPDIKDTVGPGVGKVHDIALVEAMLRVIRDAKGRRYLRSDYNGVFRNDTKDAIIRFQRDNNINDKAGFVEKDSATLKKLSASLPADLADMRIITDTTTVYLPGKADAVTDSLRQLAGAELDGTFRQKIVQLVNTMWERHKIVLSCPDSGLRRDFAWQKRMNYRGAGPPPGESNHQYGKAVDIGFKGLRWLDGDGRVKEDTYWLNLGENREKKTRAHMSSSKQQEFWNARNAIAHGELGLHKTSRAGDYVHVQAYSDDIVDYGRSLAKLLTVAGKMKWEYVPGSPRRYKSDLGLGGRLYSVGGGKQIWDGRGDVSKGEIVSALKDSTQDLALHPVYKDFEFVKRILRAAQAKKQPVPAVSGKNVREHDITQADITLVRKALKADYESADQNWKKWQIVP